MPSFPLAYASVFFYVSRDLFSLNLEQERNILASLYQEKEKREIINNDEKEINKLKENIRKELKQETEKKETA